MMNHYRILVLLLWAVCKNTNAMTFDVGTMAGLMTQPNSQYYHLSGGAYAGLSILDQFLSARFWYISRPEHKSQGFADSDYGSFLTIGHEVWRSGPMGIQTWAGRGKAGGYIRHPDSDQERRYQLWGYTFGLEAGIFTDWLTLSLCHFSFVGIDGRHQFESFVAWPFSFFTLNMGVTI